MGSLILDVKKWFQEMSTLSVFEMSIYFKNEKMEYLCFYVIKFNDKLKNSVWYILIFFIGTLRGSSVSLAVYYFLLSLL